MSTILVGSARGAPGATTLCLALAGWFEHGVLVEADPDGGVLALRYGLAREPGLTTLAAARAAAGTSLADHAQLLPSGVPVVVGPETAERATHLWRVAAPALAAALTSRADADVVVDAGRLDPSSPLLGLANDADAVVVVSRPVAAELVAASDRVARLAAHNPHCGLVLTGTGPYTAAEVTSQLDTPVLGTIPHDPRAAAALEAGGAQRALKRSALLRAARGLAETLTEPGDEATSPAHRPAPEEVAT